MLKKIVKSSSFVLFALVVLVLAACSAAATSTTMPSQRNVVSPPSLELPSPLISTPDVLNNTGYMVFAWNDLGMHCAGPTYDTAVILPPYNTIWAQVVKRGDPPQVVTEGLTVEYRIINNTYSYGKESFGQFWDNAFALFGVNLVKDKGLNLHDPTISNGLSGTMQTEGDHFVADGIPVTPIDDSGGWNPYQIGEITVNDKSGKVVAHTYLTIPVSDEFSACGACHEEEGKDTFQVILETHDRLSGTNLVDQKPVLCASCHGDPGLGVPGPGRYNYLSEAMHGFHSELSPTPMCYNCHPGVNTDCSRSIAHTTDDGNCTACHGQLSDVAGSQRTGDRIPWVQEPKCATCHEDVAQVDTGSTLYRNATGHGGLYCASCHGSPHAMVPTDVASDNYQAMQYQGAALPIGACESCHFNSKGGAGDFAAVHGGSNPEVANACAVCHTDVSGDTSQWPHAFEWASRNTTN